MRTVGAGSHRRSQANCIMRVISRRAADGRVEPAPSPTGLAAPLHALRAMVSEASTRANQRFATGTVHHLKPSIEAVN
jgi:hypothetical protein